MFIGHLAPAFAVKKPAPQLPFALAVAAASLPDFLWVIFAFAGWERFSIVPGATAVSPLRLDHFPYSHSLLATAVWAIILAAVYFAFRRDASGARWLAALVLSHWVLDVVSHTPDMPVAPGLDLKLGLGLWNSRLGTLLVEGGLFAAGAAVYARATAPRDRTGSLTLAAYVVFLIIAFIASMFAPPPPSTRAVMAGNLLGLALLVWPAWIDRHRVPRATATA